MIARHVRQRGVQAACSAAALTAVILLCGASTGATRGNLAQPGGTAALQVSHVARALQPGEVVLLHVRTPAPADGVTGHVGTLAIRFWKTADPLVWEAVLGLDLEAKAGPLRIAVRADGGGAGREAMHELAVRPKTFPARRIAVDPKFVDPPASELPRIEREAKRLTAIFAVVSPERQWTAFMPPVPGPATSAFGRVSIINGQRRSPHSGADFQAATGTPIKAPAAGTVVLSDALYFSGDTVIIDHGLGMFSLLAHLSRRDVAEGDRVKAGAVVGLSGVTGRITGPHLHWTVRIGASRVDPLSVLRVLGDR